MPPNQKCSSSHISPTNPHGTQILWEEVRLSKKLHEGASLTESEIMTTAVEDNDLFKAILILYGGEVDSKEPHMMSSQHFNQMKFAGGHEGSNLRVLRLSTDAESLNQIVTAFRRLEDLEPSEAAYGQEIRDSLLKEIKPYYKSPEGEMHLLAEWEAVRLLDHEFYIAGKGFHHQFMSIPPQIKKAEPSTQSFPKGPSSSSSVSKGGRTASILTRKSQLASTHSSSSKSTFNAAHAEITDVSFSFHSEQLKGVRPAMAYWLRRETIPEEYGHLVQSHMYVTCRKLIGPYLTVMIRDGDDEHSKKVLFHRLTMVCSVAVYNRFLLKTKNGQEQEVTSDDMDLHLRHYGLVFYKMSYQIWYCSPKIFDKSHEHAENSSPRKPTAAASLTAPQQKCVKGQWKGFVMKELMNGDLSEIGGVRELVEYINDIHQWGLTVHGPAIKNDFYRQIKNYIQAVTR